MVGIEKIAEIGEMTLKTEKIEQVAAGEKAVRMATTDVEGMHEAEKMTKTVTMAESGFEHVEKTVKVMTRCAADIRWPVQP